ncbi:MAG: ABC transporter ATP-binding protein [Clostridia bacterium]|nr:ABC transporter ATP-binding protein [Clostridia bacterium]
MEILKIQGLSKAFGDKKVLRGLDLSVPENSVFGFIGRNGAGKTTTMKTVLGLLSADEGEIYVAGKKVCYGQTETNKYIGYLPDVPEFYPFMTAKEYMNLCGESLGMKGSDITQRSGELLRLVGLEGEKHRIKGYSRGMKQRLGIAQALLGRPKLLICDEPTSALDPVGRKEILDILLSVKEHTTVLFSTHILSDVERICTDAAFLSDGKIVMQGSVEQLKDMGRAEGFTVETIAPANADMLVSAFEKARKSAKDTVVFSGGDGEMFAVMNYITENKIQIARIDRAEPSIESLFLEVAAK